MVKQVPVWVALGFVVLTAACGSSSPAAPSAPTSVTGTVNVTGTWSEKGGGTLVYQLQQNGATVTGTSSFIDRNAVFNAYSATGTVSGTVSGAVLTTTEIYQLTSQATGSPIAGCTETVTATWTITSATEMTGPFSQTDTCNGAAVFSKNGVATIEKN